MNMRYTQIQIWIVKPYACISNPRIGRGADDKKNVDKYIVRAKQSIVLEAAAQAWASGVPWAEALQCAERAVDKANPKAKAKPKSSPKAKGKAKAKPKA